MTAPAGRRTRLHRLRASRLTVVVGASLFVDTLLYTAIAPILPQLAHGLRLSKAGVGVMSASYAAAMLVGAIPGGAIAARLGHRRTLSAGLVLLGGSTIAFALLRNAILLDLARFVEGLGGACSWVAGLALVVGASPADTRGATIGQVTSAGVAGVVCGPIVGTLASLEGRGAAFAVVGVLAAVTAVFTLTLDGEAEPARHASPRLRPDALRPRAISAGMWLVALPSAASGLVNVLAPLRLHRLGAGSIAIGATFVAAAALRTILGPSAGRLSDSRGRRVPLAGGLLVIMVGLLVFVLPHAPLWLSVTVAVSYLGLALSSSPSMALLSDASEERRISPGFAGALINLAWAAGQAIGAFVGGTVAGLTGDGAPTIALGLLCGTTAVIVLRNGGGSRPSPAPGAHPTSAVPGPWRLADGGGRS